MGVRFSPGIPFKPGSVMELVDMRDEEKEKLLKLYPKFTKVYGPYRRKDGRKHIILYNVSGNRKTLSYPKALVEVRENRRLIGDETVDHINEDHEDDRLCNLQILSRGQNAAKSAYGNKNSLGYKQSAEEKRDGDKNGKAVLTNEQVCKYREMFLRNEITRKNICKETGLTDRSVRNFLNGISYVRAGGPIIKPRRVGRPSSSGCGEAG